MTEERTPERTPERPSKPLTEEERIARGDRFFWDIEDLVIEPPPPPDDPSQPAD